MGTSADSQELENKVQQDGFAIVENVLQSDEIDLLLAAIDQAESDAAMRKRGGVFAIRNLLQVVPEIDALARSSTARDLVGAVLGPDHHPVRGILFDKIPDANWKVPWHQDVTIAVQQKIEIDGYGPWSVKADVVHVQPPAAVLEGMLSLRLHLDSCTEENGALRVLPHSHRNGRISETDISGLLRATPATVCEIAAGGALLMRPLLLHASSASRRPTHRRVIHIDYSRVALPGGLCWYSESS
ncbi:MAG: phytanoyl-CoA dioxygenase family protein [Acidobacteriaceae bacterium]